jgi:hypothetical protein
MSFEKEILEVQTVERLVRRHVRSKASKGEPHERDRDGISSAGLGGSKAARGCETLRSQRLAIWESSEPTR